jgi:YidC/Oxa1 family membrane protein insertase
MSDQRNLIIAIALSLAILLGFQFLYETPKQRHQQGQQEQAQTGGQAPTPTAPVAPGAPATPGVGTSGATAPAAPAAAPSAPSVGSGRLQALKASPRVSLNAPRLTGSIALTGARIDDLVLADYQQTIEKDSPPVVLFSPPNSPKPYYARFGWAAVGDLKLPADDTVWQADGAELTAERPLTLTWDNGQGVRFVQVLEVDDAYMLTVTQRIENRSGAHLGFLHPARRAPGGLQ